VRRALVLGATLLVLAGCAAGDDDREFHVGVVEDSTRLPEAAAVRERVQAVKDAGFDSIRITSIWAPGQTEPAAEELGVLRNVATAAEELDVRLFIAVYHAGSDTTPRTE
jgi:hypothetical protein